LGAAKVKAISEDLDTEAVLLTYTAGGQRNSHMIGTAGGQRNYHLTQRVDREIVN
jgi:hypothetical protein